MEVQFPAYRHHDAADQSKRWAVMALLAALRIAQVELQSKDPEAFLPDSFSNVADLDRLNVRTTAAAAAMAQAERTLVYMAVTHALAVTTPMESTACG